MSLRLYNSRTRTTEPFAPLDPVLVRVYVCGLTPSAEAHLGHARSFMFFDVLRRYLVHMGYRVEFVRNVTDIDDRSIKAGIEQGIPWRDIVAGFYGSFQQSMRRLHVLDPDREPRATEYIAEMLEMIVALVERGSAYVVGDGVYFSVSSFARYGALSGRNVDELLVGARIAPGEEKRDPLDFALWKFAKPGEPAWPSPWGEGRPGWHIECSAMSHALLGEPFDIHGGGYDLIFPHHENEIAQSESLYPAPMANVWMHGGLLQFDGKKMSKSLGNFEPLSALLERHDPQAIRLLFLQTGYRKPMNFTEESLDGATTGLRRLFTAYDALRTAPADVGAGHATNGVASDGGALAAYRLRFFASLDDDLNTSGAVSVLFDVAAASGQPQRVGGASAAAGFLHEALGLLGISPSERVHVAVATKSATTATVGDTQYRIERRGAERVPADALERLSSAIGDAVAFEHLAAPDAVDAVVSARIAAKSAKDFALADRLRKALADIGVTIADAKDGATWTASV
jgi:cysteinyl-tRNA synthetase